MSVAAVSSLPAALPATASEPAQAPSVWGTFGRVVENYMASAARDEAHVDQAIKDLALGNSTDFHTVALTMAKADLHFRLGMEVRNKLTEAYQEIVRMQV